MVSVKNAGFGVRLARLETFGWTAYKLSTCEPVTF